MLRSREPGAAGPPGPPSRAPGGGGPGPGPADSPLLGPVRWSQRPGTTSAMFTAANMVIWFAAFSSLRALPLLAVLMVALVVMATVRDVVRSRFAGASSWCSMTASWDVMDSDRAAPSAAGPPLGHALKLFLQETSAFKQQNPGKFCLLVCSLCTFCAVLGRYIPGIALSYTLVLGFFLWPLISSHDVASWLEPVLQKLDFGFGEFLQKIKENHEKRKLQSRTERDDSDLSSMFPQLDSTVYKEMSVSDTEVSDVTWTDNGTFNLSEGHTPQTENSEDLDREEAFSGGLPEFPSLDNGATTNGDDDDDLSLGLPSPAPRPRQPTGPRQTPSGDRSADAALETLNQMAGDFIAAAVNAAIQERIEAAVGLAGPSGDREPQRLRESAAAAGPLDLAEESDSEVEDFELLDQSELEQLEQELGLGEKTGRVQEGEAEAKSSSAGFFSKLLRRH